VNSGATRVDVRRTHHPGYTISQQKRKRTEEPFGWGKTIGGLARPMLRGVARLRFKPASKSRRHTMPMRTRPTISGVPAPDDLA
jgi:hypothetical protein